MFDFAWSEIAVLGVIALVVIGPKDLPRALKTAGFMVRRARMLAREFQSSVDDMIRESELHDIREQAAKAAGVDDLKQAVQEAMDVGGEIRNVVDEPLGGPALQPPGAPQTLEGATAESPAAAPSPTTPASTEHPAPVTDHHSEAGKDAPPELHRTPPAP